jgi:S-adenosylmethionine decarboxylase
MSKVSHFGEHITIDGYGGDEKKLDSGKLLLFCLKDVAKKLKMHTIAAPQVRKVKGNGKKDPGGWSGIVLIMESHISIHTFPKRGFVSIDAYTCTNGLDRKKIVTYFKKAYSLKSMEVNFLLRGTRYPSKNIS